MRLASTTECKGRAKRPWIHDFVQKICEGIQPSCDTPYKTDKGGPSPTRQCSHVMAHVTNHLNPHFCPSPVGESYWWRFMDEYLI